MRRFSSSSAVTAAGSVIDETTTVPASRATTGPPTPPGRRIEAALRTLELIPRVVGFKLTGEIPAGAAATDVVLTITEMLGGRPGAVRHA